MTATLLILFAPFPPPPPVPAPVPQRSLAPVRHVQIIVLNRFDRRELRPDGTHKHHVSWYVSFYDLLPQIGFPAIGMPWIHRGWLHAADCEFSSDGRGGWVAFIRQKRITVCAPRLFYLETPFDFEYQNRWICGRRVTGEF